MEDVLEELNFDKLFKIMISAMKINKCHPETPRDKKWICQFLATHCLCFFVFCVLIYCSIFISFKNGDLSQACANGVISVTFVVAELQYFVMIRYRNVLKGLMDEMKTDYVKAKSLTPTEQKIIHSYAKRGKKVVVLWLVTATVASGSFPMKSIYLMIYYAIKGNFQLVPIFEVIYPSPIEENKNEPGLYFLLYTMLLLYDIYAMFMFLGVAPLGLILMLHGCGQLQIAMRRLTNIFNENDSEEIILKKINNIVKHLQDIYSFLKRVEESFKIMYELNLKACSIILPISFYQIIQSYRIGNVRIEFLAFIMGGIIFCSVPCYYSDELMDMGENVRLAVYNCGWENHLYKHKRLRTTLLFIHTRAARAVCIRTLFRNISLDALTDVYHQAYAIFNVLNASSH